MSDYMYITDLQGRKCIFYTKPLGHINTVYIHGNTPEFVVVNRFKGTVEVDNNHYQDLKKNFDNKSAEPNVTWTLVDDVVDFLVDYLYTGKEVKFRLPDGVVMKNFTYQSNDTITFEVLPPMPIDFINIDFSYGSKCLGHKDIPKPSSGGANES